MRTGMARCALVTAALWVNFSAQSVLAGDLPREIVQQFAPAAERLRLFYTHATITGTLKQEQPQAGKTVEQQFVYRVAGAQVRLDVTTMAAEGTKAKVGGSNMFMATKIGSLTTIKKPGSEVFDDAQQLSYGDTKTRINSTCMLYTIYTIGDVQSVLAFLQQPGVHSIKVQKIKRDGESLIKISYRETAGRQDRAVNWQSYFIVSPDEGWAVREYARSTGVGEQAMTYRGSLSYDAMQNGVPLVGSIQSWQEQGPQRKVIARDLVTVTNIVAGDPAAHYFTAFDF